MWAGHFTIDFCAGIWPLYKTIMHIDIATAGLIAGISGFVGELTQLFFGYISDRGYRKRVLMLGLLLASAVLCITFVSGALASFALLMLLMLGSGAFHPAAAGLAGMLSREHKSRNILIFACGGSFGLAFSQICFTKATALFHGHAYIFYLPLAVLLALLWRYPFPEQAQNRALSIKEFIRPILRSRGPLLLLYFTQVANFTLMQSFIFLLPDLMLAKNCHSWLCMGGGHLCFILGSALMMIPAGVLCDRFGHKTITLSILICAFALYYSFIIHGALSLSATILFLASMGAFMGLVSPILVSWGNKLVPESPSTVSALMMGCAWCLSNLGPLWTGLLTRSMIHEPVITSLFIIGFLLVACFGLIFFMPSVPAKATDEPELTQ